MSHRRTCKLDGRLVQYIDSYICCSKSKGTPGSAEAAVDALIRVALAKNKSLSLPLLHEPVFTVVDNSTCPEKELAEPLPNVRTA